MSQERVRLDSRRRLRRQAAPLALSVAAIVCLPTGAFPSSVAAGFYHSVAVKADGTVWTWGRNQEGQLGNGTTQARITPGALPVPTDIVAVSAGLYFTLALESDGTVWAWGWNDYGQIGVGSMDSPQVNPVQVVGLSDVVAIAAGSAHALALKADGTVWAWGNNYNGRLGDGTATHRTTPVQVVDAAGTGFLSGIVDISAGSDHTFALDAEGQVWAWGRGDNGRLGDGVSGEDRWTPVQVLTEVGALTDVVAVAAGGDFGLALKEDGTAWSWGRNGYGQMGSGTLAYRYKAAPVMDSTGVEALTGVAAIKAGRHYAFAMAHDGTVWAWGYNLTGCLGDGTTTSRTLPVAVSGFSGGVAVAPGAYHSFGLQPGGTLWAWGDNSTGRLGDGTWDRRLTPVQVASTGFMWQAASPMFEPAPGTYGAAGSVAVTSRTPRATIRYTTNGVNPEETDVVLPSGSTIPLDQNVMFKVRAWARDLAPSETATGDYVLKVASPVFAPPGGTYAGPVDVALSTSTGDAAIHYTTDLTAPGETSPAYASPVPVGTRTTLQASAHRPNWDPSDVTTGEYVFSFGTLPAPVSSPEPGLYPISVDVTLAPGPGSPAGTAIHYTTDGTDPSTASPLYAGPIPLEASATVKAIAVHLDWTQSPVSSAAYAVQVATPTLTPAGGSYSWPQDVVIASTTPGATIRYTTDGTEPTESSAAVAPGAAVLVDQTLTLKARAWKAGCEPSAVVSATFVFSGQLTNRVVAVGGRHALVVLPDGTLWAFGANDRGQLGDGSTTPRARPGRVTGLESVVAVAAGANHSLALRGDGTVWAFGWNGFGQVGDGSTTTRTTPVQVPGLSEVVAIAAGRDHSLALRSDGSVRSWGANAKGQLGDGSNTPRTGPVPVTGLSNVDAIAGGIAHSLARTTDGRLWAWGHGLYGQLGHGGTTDSWTPIEVQTLTGVASAPAAVFHSVASLADGSAWTWGDNSGGQLGDGTTDPRTTPGSVQGVPAVEAVAAGDWHTVGLTAGGDVWTWGDNAYGQLGTGGTENSFVPVQTAGLADIVAVAAGGLSNVAVSSDGIVWVWGANGSGQLGDGTNQDRPTPVRISGPGFVWRAAMPVLSPAAGSYTLAAPQAVTATSATPGATIRYTTNGADPTEADPGVPSGGTIVVDRSLVLRAAAFHPSIPPSGVVSATYTLEVASPVLTPANGVVVVGEGVTVTSPNSGATLHYTVNGAAPTQGDPTLASGSAVVLTDNAVVRVGAWREGWTPSDVAVGSFSAKTPAPVLSIPTGTYGGSQSVTVAVFEGATARYTTTGVGPQDGDPEVPPGGSILVQQTTTLRLRAWRSGWQASDTASATYFIELGTVEAPVADPPGGTYGSARTVSLASSTSGAALRYTLDGTEPGLHSPAYAGPIRIDSPTTLKARAFKAGWQPSGTSVSDYVIDAGATALPKLDPPAGRYAARQAVTVRCATPGATIRYTTDGSDPDEGDAVIASGETLTLDRSQRLKVRAWAPGLSPSAIRVADYWLTGAIAAGEYHSVALTAQGSVSTWGRNDRGQLGDGGTSQRSLPGTVPGLTGIKAVASGANHALALSETGEVWAWGANESGQLGSGAVGGNVPTPVLVSGLDGVVAVAAGRDHSLALKSDGTLVAWGNNDRKQLGGGSPTPQPVPIAVSGVQGVTALAAGDGFSLALKTDGADHGTLLGWGTSASNQLGNPAAGPLGPVMILDAVSAASAGASHAMALRTDGSTWLWGSNADLQVGHAFAAIPQRPAAFDVVAGATHVRAGFRNSFVIRPLEAIGNSLWGWGYHDGLMGDGTSPAYRRTPVRANVTRVFDGAFGFYHSLALRFDSTVWSWGVDTNGQLGLGGGGRVAVPTRIAGFSLEPSGWIAADLDGDGLVTGEEIELGLDPYAGDTNGDGILDGAAVASGISPTSSDTDGDGVPNEIERARGTNPLDPDSDGDGVLDGEDAFPLDPTRSEAPPPTPGDTTPPIITLLEPQSAVPVNP